MTGRISPREFLDSLGVEDWRLLSGGAWAAAQFRTGSFSQGVALVAAIGELAGAPDVDLRPEGVTVRLSSPAEPMDLGGLSGEDVELARQISAAARSLGLSADPAVLQHVQVAIDVLDIPAVRPFWLDEPRPQRPRRCCGLAADACHPAGRSRRYAHALTPAAAGHAVVGTRRVAPSQVAPPADC